MCGLLWCKQMQACLKFCMLVHMLVNIMQGSGKTLAFGLPILQRLMLMKSESQEGSKTTLKALILTPTRELALQVITGFFFCPDCSHPGLDCWRQQARRLPSMHVMCNRMMSSCKDGVIISSVVSNSSIVLFDMTCKSVMSTCNACLHFAYVCVRLSWHGATCDSCVHALLSIRYMSMP